MKARLREEGAVLLVATQFLTRLPVPEGAWTPARMAATPRWYPAVGLLVGAIAGLAYWAGSWVFSPSLAALVSTAVGILVTGCFHEDGFADACDGLGGGATRERKLEIMRDSRLGTYGAAGLGLMLAAKVLSLGALPPLAVPPILVAGHAASRASSVLVIATSRYRRSAGTAKPIASGIGSRGLGIALATAALPVAALGLWLPWAAVAGGCTGLALGHLLMRRAFERQLGGYTGDCLGAVQQTSEIGFYLGVLACL